jgi:hypothetical protein
MDAGEEVSDGLSALVVAEESQGLSMDMTMPQQGTIDGGIIRLMYLALSPSGI